VTTIDGLDIHFVHVRSRHPNALPLIMTHGWPGSILELVKVIGPLTDPVAYSDRAEDAFHLVLPSILGYLAGYDGGARTANIIAALWPQRCKAMVSVNGYLINNVERNKLPLPPKLEHGWWYQYYFATERGRAGYDVNRREFAKAHLEIQFAEMGIR
jgi:pimeloyl-ACP methyl ester carboxylesterase